MRYTPAQALEITKISRETLRYWRNVLPPLQGKKGKSARYSAGDLLALLIINEIVSVFEMNIAVIASVAQQIFTTCQGVRWHQISDKQLVIDIKGANVSIVPPTDSPYSSNGMLIIINIDFWQQKLRDLLVTDEAIQFTLPFNPLLVKNKIKAAS
ncbi:MAG TPA: MerR family transcriptional regulator [Bellilinea sp.]|nr:MerR family transcriptional regulator [Bellilinea sp.]